MVFLFAWLSGLTLWGFHFWCRRKQKSELSPIMEGTDWFILFVLFVCALCLYLPYIYDLPMQGNPDEITIMDQISLMMSRTDINPLGPSNL